MVSQHHMATPCYLGRKITTNENNSQDRQLSYKITTTRSCHSCVRYHSVASSSSTPRLQLVTITMPPGPFGERFQKCDGMCVVVSEANIMSPLKDMIPSCY